MKKRIFMLAVVVGLLLSLSASAWAGDVYYKLGDVTAPEATYGAGSTANAELKYTVKVFFIYTNDDQYKSNPDTYPITGYFKNANLLSWKAENFTVTGATVQFGNKAPQDATDDAYIIMSPTDLLGESGASAPTGNVVATITLTGSVTSDTDPVSVAFSLYSKENDELVQTGDTIETVLQGQAATTTPPSTTVYTEKSADDYEAAQAKFTLIPESNPEFELRVKNSKTIHLTPENYTGTVKYSIVDYAKPISDWVSVDQTGKVTITTTSKDNSAASDDAYVFIIRGTDGANATYDLTFYMTLLGHDVRDYDDLDPELGWNGLELPITNTITASGDYDKAKPALGKVTKGDLTFSGGTVKDLVVPMTGPITKLDVYVAGKDAIKLWPDKWTDKNKNISLTRENIKEFGIPFRVTSHDLKQEVGGTDKKANDKTWKKTESTVTISFNGGNVQYKGFPITISMENKNTSGKPVAKTVKLDVTPVTGVPSWWKEITESKDTIPGTSGDVAEKWDTAKAGNKFVENTEPEYLEGELYLVDDAAVKASAWGLTKDAENNGFKLDEAFPSSDKNYYIVPTSMDKADYIKAHPTIANTENYVYTTVEVEDEETGETTYTLGTILENEGNPVKASALSTPYTEGDASSEHTFVKDVAFEYTITADNPDTTDVDETETVYYIVPTNAITEDVADEVLTDDEYKNSDYYIYSTEKASKTVSYTLYGKGYSEFSKKDKPEVVTWIDVKEKDAGDFEYNNEFIASADGPYVITVKPDLTKDKAKIDAFFNEGVEAITIEQPVYDYLGNVTKHGYVVIEGSPKNTDKENKLAFTLTATNPSTKKKAALKVTAIAKTKPEFDKTTKINGEDYITTKRVEAGKLPSVKFKAKGSKTIAYKLGKYIVDLDEGITDPTVEEEDDEYYNVNLVKQLTALGLSFDAKKGAVTAIDKKNLNTPTLNTAGTAFDSLDIVVTAYNNVGSKQAHAHVAITGAKPKLNTKKVTLDSAKATATLTADVGKTKNAGADLTGANVRYSVPSTSSVKLDDLGLTLYHWDEVRVPSDDYGPVDSYDHYTTGILIVDYDKANLVSGEVVAKTVKFYKEEAMLPAAWEANYASGDKDKVTSKKATHYAKDDTIDSFVADSVLSGDATAVTMSDTTATVTAESGIDYQDDSGTITYYYAGEDGIYLFDDSGTDATYYYTSGDVDYKNGSKYIGKTGTTTPVTSPDASLRNQALLVVTTPSAFLAKADKDGKKDMKYNIDLILENYGATNKAKLTVIIPKGAYAAGNGALPGSNKANPSAEAGAAAGSRSAAAGRTNGTAGSYIPNNGAAPEADTESEATEAVTIGAPRTVADLTAGQQAYLAAKGYKVIAVLPEFTANVEGQAKDFAVELDEDAPEGAKMVYVPFPQDVEETEDDSIADFYGADGEAIEEVPAEKDITVSPWLREGVTYQPVIAAENAE